jgi:hypothetical protein
MNQDFIDLTTVSGYRLGLLDPVGKHYHFPLNVADEDLGAAVVAVLDSSRFLSANESSTLRISAQAHYEEWVAWLMRERRYRNRREMFESMRSCRIERLDDTITFIPTNHEKREGWSGEGITQAAYVTVAVNSRSAEIGASLRLAFNRCL